MHYLPVLQLALKFAIGNAALRNSSFEVFKYSKRAEADAIARSIVNTFGKRKNRAGELSVGQLQANKQRYNLLLSLLNQKIALRVWKEYLLIRDKFAAREGGIVSDRELDRLIAKQRLEEIRFYGKAQAASAVLKDIPLGRQASQILDDFHQIYKTLRDSILYLI